MHTAPAPRHLAALSAAAATPTPTASLTTFAFSTQNLSLRYPKEWTVHAKSFPRGPVTGESAEFADPSGRVVFTAFINATTYDVGWPVQRTVIESGELPGRGSQPHQPVRDEL